LEGFINQEVTLQQLPNVLPNIMKAQARGRFLVKL
ncbi:UNVERIFIED_CONTAM: oxidoreductase, partial [Escherichia coli]